MPYKHLILAEKTPAVVKSAIESSVELYLSDVHTMLLARHSEKGNGGCNYSAAIVLCSVIAALSQFIYPRTGNDNCMFCELLLKHYPWPAEPKGIVSAQDGADVLYRKLRNSLVHCAGLPIAAFDSEGVQQIRHRSPGIKVTVQKEPITEEQLEMDECSVSRPTRWGPTIHRSGRESFVFVNGLYWAVRRMVCELSSRDEYMRESENLLAGDVRGARSPVVTKENIPMQKGSAVFESTPIDVSTAVGSSSYTPPRKY